MSKTDTGEPVRPAGRPRWRGAYLGAETRFGKRFVIGEFPTRSRLSLKLLYKNRFRSARGFLQHFEELLENFRGFKVHGYPKL